MIKIRQHGTDGALNVIAGFLADLDRFYAVDAWRVRIEWCLGEGADDIEKRSNLGLELPDSEFREWYRGIYQTVDGSFGVVVNGKVECELLAVDSSYWEITAACEFESYMLAKYGPYAPGNEI